MWSILNQYNYMIGIKQKENAPAGGLHNTLAAGTAVKGDIITETDFRLDGKVEGNITCAAKIVIGPKAQVTGDISSVNAEVLGTVEGNIKINGVLILKSSAIVKGDISAHTLEIEPNACFNGVCSMISEEK